MSLQTLHRLPIYLNLLKEKHVNGEYISAGAIAAELGLVEIQVRKDLACISSAGRPKVGYSIEVLIRDINTALGYNNVNDAVLIGAGKLGKALLAYEGFQDYGLNIIAAFDTGIDSSMKDESGKTVYPMSKLKDLCDRLQIRIGIITVPASSAQSVCDMLVASGVSAIWNFAPTHLKTSDGILVKNENMAVSLAELSQHLRENMHGRA